MSTSSHFNTANPYEKKYGYSRAIRRGSYIFVSGTTSFDPETGEFMHPSSAYQQALLIFSVIIRAIEGLGGTKSDITRVRMFVTSQDDSGDVGRALLECLGDISPAATMVIGPTFVAKEMKVEIEGDAVVL
ncbi:YjgF-like protein [Mycena floridula]|nr:YjgF-like protein [Mycena floridula]